MALPRQRAGAVFHLGNDVRLTIYLFFFNMRHHYISNIINFFATQFCMPYNTLRLTLPPTLHSFTNMMETRRLLEAAIALSQLLRDHGVAHAFYGNLLTAVLANSPQSDVSSRPNSKTYILFIIVY